MDTRDRHLPSFLVVAAVFGTLALLVGLVASGGKRAARPRSSAPAEPFELEERHPVELVAAPALPDDDAPQRPASPRPLPAPATTVAHPAQAKRAEFARVTGIVLRPEGEPAANARVALGKQSARCDHEGRFELAVAAAPTGADLVAYEPGFEPAFRPSFGSGLAEGFQGEVRLVLGPPTQAIHGQIVDFAGSPVKGWTVELDEPDPLHDLGFRERVRTEADGLFTVSDVPAGVHVLRAWKQDPSQSIRSDPVDAGAAGVKITVDE